MRPRSRPGKQHRPFRLTVTRRWSAPNLIKNEKDTKNKQAFTIRTSVEKTFYIETFGCQMNAHDSEKVIGTLLEKGYSQVDTVEAAQYVFYNTCSIRDKAEQKVFNRLQHFKREAGKGKVFAVIGCVAQQEGNKIFDRAPHVNLVAGSASYTKL